MAVTPGVSVASVNENGARPRAARTALMRVRSSVMCAALTGVPALSTSSVKGTVELYTRSSWSSKTPVEQAVSVPRYRKLARSACAPDDPAGNVTENVCSPPRAGVNVPNQAHVGDVADPLQ